MEASPNPSEGRGEPNGIGRGEILLPYWADKANKAHWANTKQIASLIIRKQIALTA